MYRRILKPILFSLTIERAHRLVLVLLRIAGLIPGGRWLLAKCHTVRHPALEREVFGRRFPNPVGLAAGFDSNAEAFRELAAMGFGFIEVGTITPRAQGGNPRPRVFRLPKDRAIVNRIGLANRGLSAALRRLRRPRAGIIVGCNIGRNASTPPEQAAADYLKTFRSLYQYADYFTVNISCDNACHEASHTREHILQILDPLFDFRRGQNQYRPVLLKISPDMPDETIDRITDVLLSTPLDGIVATNGTNAREGLHTSRAAIDKIGGGRLSGAPLTHRAVEIVRRIHTRSGGAYPIIGVGGLMTPDDVLAMLDAGADLVQLYTGYIYNGPRLVKEICRTLIADADAKAGSGTAGQPDAETDAPAASERTAEVQAAPAAAPSPNAPAEARPQEAERVEGEAKRHQAERAAIAGETPPSANAEQNGNR